MSDFWDEHRVYTQTPEWKALRERALTRDHHQCQMCGATAMHVHHLTYRRWKNASLFDLVSLCHPCHSKEHDRDLRGKTKLVGGGPTSYLDLRCWNCGQQHAAGESEHYLCWWDDAVTPEEGPLSPAIFKAGIYCNGSWKLNKPSCRDIVTRSESLVRGRVLFPSDLPVSYVTRNVWEFLLMRADYRFTKHGMEEMLLAASILAQFGGERSVSRADEANELSYALDGLSKRVPYGVADAKAFVFIPDTETIDPPEDTE